jgi:DNA-directed RNA polymerase specialized sigma24 family protein
MPMGLATAQDLARLRPQLHKIADALRAPGGEEPLDVKYALVSRLDDAIGRNLERLPVNSGRVFVLRYVLEMESQEICAMRECPDLQGLVADAL